MRTVDVGGTLIKVTTAVKSAAFFLRSELQATSVGDPTTTYLTVQPGILIGKYLDARHDCYVSDQPIKVRPALGDVQVSAAGVCFDHLSPGGVIFFAIMQDGSSAFFHPVDPIDGEETTYIDDSAPSLSRALIYNGKTGQTIKILYREFSQGMADRAPDQETQHDLNKSRLIEVKGARIEVVQATDTTLTYKVLVDLP